MRPKALFFVGRLLLYGERNPMLNLEPPEKRAAQVLLAAPFAGGRSPGSAATPSHPALVGSSLLA